MTLAERLTEVIKESSHDPQSKVMRNLADAVDLLRHVEEHAAKIQAEAAAVRREAPWRSAGGDSTSRSPQDQPADTVSAIASGAGGKDESQAPKGPATPSRHFPAADWQDRLRRQLQIVSWSYDLHAHGNQLATAGTLENRRQPVLVCEANLPKLHF